jgi:hypothetical protein
MTFQATSSALWTTGREDWALILLTFCVKADQAGNIGLCRSASM